VTISLQEAFAQLDLATSVADLRALVNDVDAKTPSWFDNPNGITLQLYAGDLGIDMPAHTAAKNVAGNLMPNGSSLIIIDQTVLGSLLLDEKRFFTKLGEVIENDLQFSHIGFNDLLRN